MFWNSKRLIPQEKKDLEKAVWKWKHIFIPLYSYHLTYKYKWYFISSHMVFVVWGFFFCLCFLPQGQTHTSYDRKQLVPLCLRSDLWVQMTGLTQGTHHSQGTILHMCNSSLTVLFPFKIHTLAIPCLLDNRLEMKDRD